jgi:hypothetical protein
MAKFLIEVPHNEDQAACLRALEVFVSSGNHFLANAEWGCEDSEHKAWMIVDLESREQAIQILPSMYRDRAKVTKLFQITREDVRLYKEKHRLESTEDSHQL